MSEGAGDRGDELNQQLLKLVDQSDNCKHWSGQDAAASAIEQIKLSPNPVKKLLVLWYEPNDKGGSELRYSVAGLSREEHIAMLQTFLFKATQNFIV